MPIDKINSIEDLRLEKERLHVRIKTSQTECLNSLGDARRKLGPVLLYKFAIPASAASLAALWIKKMVFPDKKEPREAQQSYQHQEGEDVGFSWSNLILRFLPTILTLVQSYFTEAGLREEAEQKERTT